MSPSTSYDNANLDARSSAHGAALLDRPRLRPAQKCELDPAPEKSPPPEYPPPPEKPPPESEKDEDDGGSQLAAEPYPVTRSEIGVENWEDDPAPVQRTPEAPAPGEDRLMRIVAAGS